MKFAIQTNGWESTKVLLQCIKEGVPYILNKYEPGYAAVGSVAWVEQCLGKKIKPDYFPKFLSKYVTRHVFDYDGDWALKPASNFIKPADQYKRFDGHVLGLQDLPAKPWVCSEIVKFTNEWRYYVLNGKVIDKSWYLGDTESEAPQIDVDWGDWSGTADFGTLEDGRIELVEAHHPVACGWYPSDKKNMLKFLYDGFEYTKNL